VKKNKTRIINSSQMEYRGSEFYDCGENVDFVEFSPLYREISENSDNYSDSTKIDAGGMKSIYRVFDKNTGRYLAMAKLHDDTPEELYEPFIREARLTAALEHPNIIKVHEINLDSNGAPFFTMDLKIGDSLSDILEKLKQKDEEYLKQYQLRSLMMIYLKICDAIAYSHSREILHLDLKPENIQVGHYGEVLVCDWGLAKIIGQETNDDELLLNPDLLNNVTLSGHIKGTPGYMSPEQVDQQKHKTKAMDIYALGAILYSLLTIERPLEGDTDEILTKTLEGQVISPKLRTPDADIPDSLNAVVLKAMNIAPDKRYVTVDNLTVDIHKYLDGYSTGAENADAFKELSLFYQRNKTLCKVSIGALITLITATIIFINYLNQSRNNEELARKEAEANQHAAEVSRIEAEMNFKKYVSEKEMLELSLSSNLGRLIHDLRKGFYDKVLRNPEEEINEVMKKIERIEKSNRKDLGIYNFKTRLHFIRQEFDLAYEALKKGSPAEHHSHAFLYKALEAVQGHKKNADGTVPVEVVGKAIMNLGGHFKDQVTLLVLLDYQTRKNPVEHAQIVKYALRSLNFKWAMDEYIYNAENNSLKVSGRCNHYSYTLTIPKKKVNLLRTLGLEKLDIRGVNGFSTSSLKGLKLKELDIRGLSLNSPDKQVIGPDVTEVIRLTPKKIQPDLLQKIKGLIKVKAD
jgi:serine/threonine protein kinase